jgi:hypothetical protein
MEEEQHAVIYHLVYKTNVFQTEQSLHHPTGTTATEHPTLDLTLSVVVVELVHGHQDITDEENGFKLILDHSHA